MKLVYSALLAALSIYALASCGSGKAGNSDSLRSDSIVEETRKEFAGISFKTADEVRKFLDFKKFSDGDRYIAFNGKGGMIDNEAFSITDVSLRNDSSAVIAIHIPKLDLSGKFLLNVADSEVSILDEEAKRTYKLQM